MEDTTDRRVPKIFLDTNILLDYLYFRGEDALATEYLFDACIRGDVECCIAAHSICNLFYITRKDFSVEESTQIVLNFCAICNVQSVSGKTIEDAIEREYSADLEDALQMQCALESKAEYLLTRDAGGFANSPVKVLTVRELVRELSL